ncbi:hypothetical protein D9M73_273080 [compost metagenome]
MKFWNTNPACWRKRRIAPCCPPKGRLASMLMAPIWICPASGVSSRLRQRKKVVLPEPLGPMMATTSPGCTVRSIPLSTVWPLNRLVRPLTSIMLNAPGHAG